MYADLLDFIIIIKRTNWVDWSMNPGCLYEPMTKGDSDTTVEAIWLATLDQSPISCCQCNKNNSLAQLLCRVRSRWEIIWMCLWWYLVTWIHASNHKLLIKNPVVYDKNILYMSICTYVNSSTSHLAQRWQKLNNDRLILCVVLLQINVLQIASIVIYICNDFIFK